MSQSDNDFDWDVFDIDTPVKNRNNPRNRMDNEKDKNNDWNWNIFDIDKPVNNGNNQRNKMEVRPHPMKSKKTNRKRRKIFDDNGSDASHQKDSVFDNSDIEMASYQPSSIDPPNFEINKNQDLRGDVIESVDRSIALEEEEKALEELDDTIKLPTSENQLKILNAMHNPTKHPNPIDTRIVVNDVISDPESNDEIDTLCSEYEDSPGQTEWNENIKPSNKPLPMIRHHTHYEWTPGCSMPKTPMFDETLWRKFHAKNPDHVSKHSKRDFEDDAGNGMVPKVQYMDSEGKEKKLKIASPQIAYGVSSYIYRGLKNAKCHPKSKYLKYIKEIACLAEENNKFDDIVGYLMRNEWRLSIQPDYLWPEEINKIAIRGLTVTACGDKKAVSEAIKSYWKDMYSI